ncbi:MAG: 16S rRNA (guanine(527)-N(7))-methyltransferase RsmG [Pelagibacteraceae bacterium]|nr:MAG: 16S rRNA (guanine(527)-N(7))-methyltransferase RsmG [Pelagibacteraceae bacterium]
MHEDIEFFTKKFNVSRETEKKLNIYKKLLLEKNKSLNLIGKSTENSIFTRHFADSAQIYELIDKKFDIIDFGTGAGFPGIIVKILMDNDKLNGNVILLEKSPNKCKFLKDLSNKLGLEIQINNTRIENYFFNKVSTVISRAFKSTIDTIEIVLKNREKLKEVILLKGKTYQQELDDAKKKYTFDVEKFRSITSDDSSIIKITNIRNNTT